MITLSSIVRVLKTSFTFVKAYWQYFLIAAAFILGMLVYRRTTVDFSRQLKEIQDRQREEIDEIRRAYDNELKQKEENERRLQDRIEKIQRQFEDAKQTLDDEKQKQVKDLVEKYGDDPVVLAQKLSQLTGFIVVIPPMEEDE